MLTNCERDFSHLRLLTSVMKQIRLERSKLLRIDMKIHGNLIPIYSDEKTFTVDPVINKQNHRVVQFGLHVPEIRKILNLSLIHI